MSSQLVRRALKAIVASFGYWLLALLLIGVLGLLSMGDCIDFSACGASKDALLWTLRVVVLLSPALYAALLFFLFRRWRQQDKLGVCHTPV